MCAFVEKLTCIYFSSVESPTFQKSAVFHSCFEFYHQWKQLRCRAESRTHLEHSYQDFSLRINQFLELNKTVESIDLRETEIEQDVLE
jgi:ADP-dependent phosphofructokinase/glucokinase